MSLANEIIAAHAGRESVRAGDLVTVKIDRAYVQDGNSPTIRRLFAEHGFSSVFDPHRVAIFFDHSVTAPDKHIANRLREARDFADGLGVQIFAQGTGISHVIALDNGWFEPGTIVVGSDSHTCTGGALQCLALGMGASDIAAAIVTGETWLRVPETVWLETVGQPSSIARPKDVMLYILANFPQANFLYKSIEWCGAWAGQLSFDGAATVANMGVELGAKCSFLPPGPNRRERMRPIVPPEPGDIRRMTVNIDSMPPMVARPNSPANAVPIDDCAGEKINYVFIGSCTNSRLEDIAEAARVFETANVHRDVYCIVTPGSKDIYLQALELGYIDTFVRAGAIVTAPGCSACLGTQGSIPASGDRVLSTMNRNFLGRMGNPESEIFLGSPLVAAQTAVQGRIPHTNDLVA